jgi:uncharacterized RDD family membrane protein YckC
MPPPPDEPYGYGQPQPPGYGQPQAAGYGYGGPPAPAYASWIKRVGAALINGIIAAVIGSILNAVTGVDPGEVGIGSLVSTLIGLFFGYQDGATGQSLGKKLLNIRVVRERDGQVIGGGMGIVRQIAHIIDGIPCLIGYLWPLWDKKKQTFADKIIGTVVVDA